MFNGLLCYYYYGIGNGLYFDAYTLVFIALIAVMIIGLVVQARLNSMFKKYSKVRSASGRTANEVARELIANGGCDTAVTSVAGSLTDHFNPKTNTVGLSQSVYGSDSVAALAVAAHEIGHVMQYKEDYLPIKIRNAVLPIANIGSMFAPYIVLFGLIFSSFGIAMMGVYLYAAVLGFQLVTLPVEFNASSRAVNMLVGGGYITREEAPGAKKVLRMAATTYVVATLATLISLIRLMLIANSSRRD